MPLPPDSAILLLLTELRSRIADLDAENARLRDQLAQAVTPEPKED